MSIDELKQIIEDNGFAIYEDGDELELSQYTPEGEDWNETFEFKGDPNVFIQDLIRRINNFDIDDEVEPYVAMRGKQGVPSSISALLADAQWKLDTLTELQTALQNHNTKTEESKLQEAEDDEKETTDSEIEQIEDEETENLDNLIQEWEEKSPLHERVISEIVEDSENYEGTKLDRIKSRLGDVSHGLATGVVGSLIYYSDTTKFFDEYYDDIWDVIEELADYGLEPMEAIKRNCSETEILMGSDNVKNWVVWMVYEEIAYQFYNDIESL